MVLGENANMAGEAASRASLDLPGRQQELLEAVVALGKPVVLVLLNGRPLAISWAAEHVPAILEAWEPGSEGGHAVADILFGDVNPGGKLPVTFPRRTGQAPLYYARTLTHSPEGSMMYNPRYWDGPVSPLYPFGFGLSYTTFSIDNLKVSMPQVKVGGSLAITADVANTGSLQGDEVVQLYIHQKAGQRLAPDARAERLRTRDAQARREEDGDVPARSRRAPILEHEPKGWVQDAEAFDVWVGADSTAKLSAGFTVVR